ncbi:hypothetical protein [Streptomyces sp. KR80]|uniref:hypothetical protein n=1 Tax=Streptomyces sp. KR80 TaxID=3457426 RepID=UPI003FD1EA6A
MSARSKIVVLTVAGALLATVALTYTLHAAHRTDATAASSSSRRSELALDRGGLLHLDGTDRVARLGGGVSNLSCERFHASARRAVCLTRRPGLPPRSEAVVLDRKSREVRRVKLAGIPNRARVSPSGRMIAWTTFVTGDSYATSSFSTRTGILDMRTGYLIKSIESIPLRIDGRRYHAPDVNYWGVTFARDDNRFYATVSSAGRTYLVAGDMAKWSARALRRNAECPSLSPDGTRVVFKKKVSGNPRRPWRLHVLDLTTMRETPLAERASVDDQAAWLDDRTVAYARPGRARGTSDIWSVPADGSGAPRLLVHGGSSPAPVGSGRPAPAGDFG